jgi:predicted extracellular nuclease
MRRRLVLAVTVLSCALAGAQSALAAPSELFFSEYIEGSSNNKALEIFNGTGVPVNLGTGGYNVQMFFNGSATAGLTINLTGTVASGDVFVLAQSSANETILAQADQTNGGGWFNGDDAVVLRKGTTVVDVIGQIGFDPGSEWGTGLTSTADNTLRRKAAVEAGNADGSDTFDPAAEWEGFATDTSDGLGGHIVVGDAPFVASTSPSSGATNVPTTSDVDITFSEPVTVTAATFSISCPASGTHAFALSGGPAAYTLAPTVDFLGGETCTVRVDDAGVSDVDTNDPPDTMAADHVFSFTTVPLAARVYEVQGASHVSPLAGRLVSAPGVVTSVRPNSFTMQDPTGDGNAATSDGILVFGTAGSSVSVGQAVTVSGRVTEFRPGGAESTNLTTTEITSPTVTPGGPGAAIVPTVIGAGGRVPPTAVIDDDATGDVETSGSFDAATDGIDFWESLEATLLRVPNPVVVGPTNSRGEMWVLANDGAGAGIRTARHGIVIGLADFNPERIQLDDDIVLESTPDANVGDHFTSDPVGVLDYNFGSYELLLTSPVTRSDGGLVREATRAQRADELAVASFNVENLSPADPPAKFARLAGLIVDNLRSPDVVAVQEIQDNDGPADTGVTDATQTFQQLIAAIQSGGGPAYQFRQINPVDNEDGGQPGGNIRVGLLFRTDRGLAFVDRPGGTSTTPTAVTGKNNKAQLTFSPGRIDPQNEAWTDSRKPLAAELRFRGQTLFVIVNHFNSKSGDSPLYGRFQPTVRLSEVQRHRQAQVVNDFVDQILGAFKNARIVVLGDLNDFEFSETLQILEGGGALRNLMDRLPKPERYSYVFEGNSQVLDQMLVSEKLDKRNTSYDVVHVNAEFSDQASDHDPSVARFVFDDEDE